MDLIIENLSWDSPQNAPHDKDFQKWKQCFVQNQWQIFRYFLGSNGNESQERQLFSIDFAENTETFHLNSSVDRQVYEITVIFIVFYHISCKIHISAIIHVFEESVK